MRLFIALPLPPEIQHYIFVLKTYFRKTEKINFSPQSHLTLKFLGETTPAKTKQTQQKLTRVTFPHFRLTLSLLGVFPDENTPRVLWISVKPEKPVVELHHRIDDTLKKLFSVEQNFKPHITIGRIKHVAHTKTLIESLQKFQVKPLHFTVKEFFLMKSELNKEIPRHTILQRYSTAQYKK